MVGPSLIGYGLGLFMSILVRKPRLFGSLIIIFLQHISLTSDYSVTRMRLMKSLFQQEHRYADIAKVGMT